MKSGEKDERSIVLIIIMRVLPGLTIRLAQTLGLHCSPDPDNVAIDQKGEATVKYYIWYVIISFSYEMAQTSDSSCLR